MNRDEIIAMAREAGAGLSSIAEPLEHPWKLSQDELERFAALVAAAEREACACFALINGKDAPTPEERDMAWAIAVSIRARSKP